MSKLWWDQMAIINLTGTTYASATGSKYTPVVDGRLRAVKIVTAGDSASSLMESLDVKLTSPEWGRDLVCSQGGAGLRTAPAFGINDATYEVDLPVKASQGITLEARWNVTATSPHAVVMGLFESNQ